MRINNVDALEHLAEKIINLDVPQYVLDVVRPLEREFRHIMLESILMPGHFHTPGKVQLPHSPIRKFEHYHYENVANLLHTIPIYLRDTRPEEYNRETDIVDALGAYFPNRNNDDPYIELYLSNIDSCAGGDNHDFRWIFTITLIHELAHAALDIFNQVHCDQAIEKVQYCTEFGKWREESMANAVALRIIKAYGDKNFYAYAKQFMLSQPDEYALVVLMEDFGYWDFRSVTDGKEDGVHPDLQEEWLKYVKGNPVWGELQRWNKILSSHYVYYYQNNYYTSEEELVKVIVRNILDEYVASNGKKMSIAEFQTIFPYIKTGAEMSYEPSEKVAGDSRYDKIELADGDLSLYHNGWDNDTLRKFVKNTGCQFDEYKNW